MDRLIKKFALQNAVRYGGTANPGAVLGKVLQVNPRLKKNIAEVQKKVHLIVDQVNQRSILQQEAQLKKFHFRERKKIHRPYPPLKQTNNVVMRFEPSPSGALHIGHAIVLALNQRYCQKYHGSLILRIGDTNPDTIYPPAYKLISEDVLWLTRKGIKKVVLQSSRFTRHYGYMQKLFQIGGAYVCTCKSEKFASLLRRSISCPCRNNNIQVNVERWKNMLRNAPPGSMVVRIKTNLMHKNPALRDWPAMRINTKNHPKTGKKFRVYPLMNFAVAIDDHEMKVTASIRAKDHIDNAMKQRFIYEYFNWSRPQDLFIGRITFRDRSLSARAITASIVKKKYTGWEDIRLPSVQALKRRGYQPTALVAFADTLGITEVDKTVTTNNFFQLVNAHNRQIIEPIAPRYFFVHDPVALCIDGAPKQQIKVPIHPDFPRRGHRIFHTHEQFYIQRSDFVKMKKGIYRLMHCLNLQMANNRITYHSREYSKLHNGIFHWLPKGKQEKIEVLLPNGKKLGGLGESALRKLRIGTVLQFERFGFVSLQKKMKSKLIFWFTHE